MTETTGVTITPEQYNAIQHLTRHLGSKRSIVETHRVILDHGGWMTKTVADFALLNSISVADMKLGLDNGWNVQNEPPVIKKEDITIHRAENNKLGFDDDLYSGISVIWRHDAIGQGTIDLVIDKSTGQLIIDTETMGKDVAKLVFEKLIDEAVD